MEPDEAGEAFLARLAARSLALEALPVEQGVEEMLAFYAEERCDACDLENDGDMLLYQWGYAKARRTYELDLTRQLITGEGDDATILQLSLTFHFAADAVLAALPAGDEWCPTPAHLEAFRDFIQDSAAYVALSSRTPDSVTLGLESV